MVTIISKSDGPRREDEAARRLLEGNRGTITRLADHLTQGAYSANRAARVPQQTVVPASAGRASVSVDNPRPYVKISANGRVVLVDLDSARQLAFLGEIRRRDGGDVFVLARGANGFSAALEEEMEATLDDIDGLAVHGRDGEASLKAEIALKLGLA